MYTRWYELNLDICHSGYLSPAPNCFKEHEARDVVHLYEKMMCKSALEFGDTVKSICTTTKQEPSVSERVAAVKAGDLAKVAHIDTDKKERHK